MKMEHLSMSLENLSIKEILTKRTQTIIENQQKKNLEKSENSLRDKTKYRCNKCRDLTFIIEWDIAIPCECRALREVEEALKSSGISAKFRKKTFEIFDYTYDIQVVEAYKKANKYINSFNEIKDTRNNSIMFL